MTDNQTIDVTKCIHFDKSDMPNGCTCYWDGECNHDCYYKQLKRAEKRIVDLNKTIQAKEQERERPEQTLIQVKDIAENVQSFVGRINIEDDVFEQMEQIL